MVVLVVAAVRAAPLRLVVSLGLRPLESLLGDLERLVRVFLQDAHQDLKLVVHVLDL